MRDVVITRANRGSRPEAVSSSPVREPVRFHLRSSRPARIVLSLFDRERLWGQVLRFGIVGGLNTLVDYGTFNLLVVVFGMHPVAANPISVAAGIVNSFLWNKHWTFGAGGWHRWYRQAVLFVIVSVIGLFINTGCLWLLTHLTGARSVLAVNLLKLAASIVSLTWNFIGYRFLVFRRRQRAVSG